ncbi:RNA-guided endonuclease TnpB family protein [Archaeoglobus profundus]|nr:RNA-guided endonuclease TnpB family protein [Archaeoglobus profundus]
MGDEVSLTGVVEMTVRAEPLVQLIRNYTNALRFVVHEILRDPSKYGRWRYVKRSKRIKWEHDLRRIHHSFYEVLKYRFSLPPKFAIACQKEAVAIVKSVLNNENNGGKCVIKNYRARVDYQAYKIEVRNGKCYLKLRNFDEIEVTGFSRKWFTKFKDWRLGDLIMKLENGLVKLFVTFKKTVKVAEPSENAVAVDLNFEEVVLGNHEFEVRFKTPLRKIIHLKKNHIEKTQKKYNRKWRYVKGIRNAISRWWSRINGITNDFVKQVSRRIVVFVKERGYDTIVLEDLNGLKDEQAKLRKSWRERFTFFAYRKLQNWIEWQAKKEGLAVVYVNPANTSKTCPKCKSLNTEFRERILICKDCGFTMNRDSVAVINLVDRWLSIMGCAV